MATYLSIPLLGALVIIQSTIVPEARIAGGMPDLIFLVVLAWGLMAGFEQGVTWAFIGGILQDLVSSLPLGTTSLALVLAVTIASLVLGRVHPHNVIYPALAAGVGTLFVHLVTLAVLLAVGRPLPLFDLLVYVTLPSMVYNVVVMIPVYRILGTFYLSARPRRVQGV